MRKIFPSIICSLAMLSMLAACSDGFRSEGGNASSEDGNIGGNSAMLGGDAPEDNNDGAFYEDESGGDGGDAPGSDAHGGSGDDAYYGDATLPDPLSLEADLGIEAGGTWFPIFQDVSGLVQALGDDYELYAAPSCVFDEGDDKQFAYDGICLNTNPWGGTDICYSIYIESDAYASARGIKVGDSLAEVIGAYGGRYYWEGDTILTYSISGTQDDISSPCIVFTISQERVTAIEIYYPTNTT